MLGLKTANPIESFDLTQLVLSMAQLSWRRWRSDRCRGLSNQAQHGKDLKARITCKRNGGTSQASILRMNVPMARDGETAFHGGASGKRVRLACEAGDGVVIARAEAVSAGGDGTRNTDADRTPNVRPSLDSHGIVARGQATGCARGDRGRGLRGGSMCRNGEFFRGRSWSEETGADVVSGTVDDRATGRRSGSLRLNGWSC